MVLEAILLVIIGIISGIIIGSLATWTIVVRKIQNERNKAQIQENDWLNYRTKAEAEFTVTNSKLEECMAEKNQLKNDTNALNLQISQLNIAKATLSANIEAVSKNYDIVNQNFSDLNVKIQETERELNESKSNLLIANQTINNLNLKLEEQKEVINDIQRKFIDAFKNLSNEILNDISARFTKTNTDTIGVILKPLEKEIEDFSKSVESLCKEASIERTLLSKETKELARLNQIISDETKKLTTALKGESKTQGNWGEMILESILEKSGLENGREYFLQYELKDKNGKALLSEDGKKMRPDAVIKYPDDRCAIVDSKVSLNAFLRMLDTDDLEKQQNELKSHVLAVKSHINTLKARQYDNYFASLDFVMMFMPSEPAYISALQGDSELWNYAYENRILLLSPTNFITSLKLIAELWKREYQNRNVVKIAERGAKIYDKFVGFVSSLSSVGKHLDNAQTNYKDAFSKLSTGKGNLIVQIEELKKLGLNSRSNLPNGLIEDAYNNQLPEESEDV
jgi:DNA recombination protein RmuC